MLVIYIYIYIIRRALFTREEGMVDGRYVCVLQVLKDGWLVSARVLPPTVINYTSLVYHQDIPMNKSW